MWMPKNAWRQKHTRSTANAAERPSPVHLLRAAVTISETSKFQFEVVDDPLYISTCYFVHLLGRAEGSNIQNLVRVR